MIEGLLLECDVFAIYGKCMVCGKLSTQIAIFKNTTGKQCERETIHVSDYGSGTWPTVGLFDQFSLVLF